MDKFSDEFYDRWQHLLEDIDMTDIPLEFVRVISVNMRDGSVVDFDVQNMLKGGYAHEEIEFAVQEFLQENNDKVGNLDFHININEVASEVTKKVKRLLD